MSEQATPTPNPVRRQDAETLVGVLAVLQGQLIGGSLDEDVVARLVRRFVRAGLLEPDPDGSPPSAGRLGVALDNLNQRLRYALGEYETEPAPGAEGIVHELRLPDEEAASRAREALGDAVTSWWVDADQDGYVQLFVVGGDLPPDPDFVRLDRELQDLARRLGGLYRGWGGPPPGSGPSDSGTR